MFTVCRLMLLACCVSVALGIGTLRAAEDGQSAPDMATLQAEIARLKAEVAVLQAKLDEAQRINGELVKKLAAQPATGTAANTVEVPRDGTELSLTQVLADREKYWQAGTSVVIIGGAYVEDDANKVADSVTFHLRELRPDKKAGRLSAVMLVPTAISRPLVDAVGEATTRGLDGKVVRLRASLLMDTTGDMGQNLLLSVKDYQLLDSASNTWGPWQSETMKAAKPAVKTERKPAAIAELVGAAQRWLAAPKQETEAARHERRDKITSDLVGRKMELRGVLGEVHKDPKGTVSAEILYISSRQVEQTVSRWMGGNAVSSPSKEKVPAETILLRITQANPEAITLKKGSQVSAQAVIEGIEFGSGGRPGVADWVTSGGTPPEGAVHIFVTATEGSLKQ